MERGGIPIPGACLALLGVLLLLQQVPDRSPEGEDPEAGLRARLEEELRGGVRIGGAIEWRREEGKGVFSRGAKIASLKGGLRLRAERGVVWTRRAAPGDGDGLPIREIFAEGHIIFEWGDDTLLADRFYFDFDKIQGRAEGVRLSLRKLKSWVDDGEESGWGKGVDRSSRGGANWIREVHISADELRILGPSHYKASQAEVTTCDYGEPHYSLHASSVEVTDGRRIRIRGATARIFGVPIFYWPYLYWSMDWNPYIPTLRVGRSSEFGNFLQSDWTLYSGKGIRLTADVDYFEERGTGYGGGLRYRKWRMPLGSTTRWGMLGRLHAYGIRDRGEDELYLPPGEVQERNRWRGRWLHRQWLPFDWVLFTEYSEASDRNFLAEYFEREFRVSKEQENLVYLKRIGPAWGLTLLAKQRRNDFDTTTEALPQVAFEIVKAPVVRVPLIGRRLYYSQRTEFGNFRHRPDDVLVQTGIDVDRNGIYFPKSLGGPWDLDPPHIDTYDPDLYDLDGDGDPEYLPRVRSWRFDTFHEARLPVPLGPVTVAPFVTGRYTSYQRTLVSDDSADRGQAGAGLRFDTQVHRTWDAELPDLGVDGLRHIFNPSLTYFIRYLNTKGPRGFIYFDAIDRIDETESITLNLRNRIQTRRRLPAGGKRAGPTSVDLFDLEIQGSYLPSRRDPVTRREFSNIDFDLRTNLIPYLVLFGQAGLDPVDGDVETWSIGGLTMRPGKYAAGVSLRKVQPTFRLPGSDLPRHFLTYSANLNLTEKWAVEARGQYDLTHGRMQDQTYSVKRYLHQWVMGLSVGVDEGREDTAVSFYITLRDLDAPTRVVFGGRQDFAGLDALQ